MSLNSGIVSIGDTATASQYNNIRKDILQKAGDFATSGGSANAQTVANDGQITSLTTGLVVKFIAGFTNTSAVTITYGSLGPTPLKKGNVLALSANDINAGQAYYILYDGTNWQLLNSIATGKWGGNGADGAINGGSNVTITGSDNSYIVKNYTSWAAGSRTLTITPVNSILHIKIQGNCDLSNWTLSFAGTGGRGGTGGARGVSISGVVSGNAGTDGLAGNGYAVAPLPGIGAPTQVNGNTGGVGGTAGTVAVPIQIAFLQSGKSILIAGGGGGGGACAGGSGVSEVAGAGGDGGAGGGCVIFEIAGDVTFSSTTANFNGVNGSNGVNGDGTAGDGGGGGGGGGGCFVALYNGVKTGSLTPNVAGGTHGNGGTTSNIRGGGGGGGGGASLAGNGTVGSVGNSGGSGGIGGNGGDGAAGSFLIEQNVTFP